MPAPSPASPESAFRHARAVATCMLHCVRKEVPFSIEHKHVGVIVGVVAKIAEKRLLSLIAGSRLNSEVVGEPVVGIEPTTYGLQNGRRWFRVCRTVSLSKVLLRSQYRQVSLDVGVGRVFGRQNGRQKHRFRRRHAFVYTSYYVRWGLNSPAFSSSVRLYDPLRCIAFCSTLLAEDASKTEHLDPMLELIRVADGASNRHSTQCFSGLFHRCMTSAQTVGRLPRATHTDVPASRCYWGTVESLIASRPARSRSMYLRYSPSPSWSQIVSACTKRSRAAALSPRATSKRP